MGRHTEEFRALIASIPDHTKGLTLEIARACVVQIANGALQIIAGLEETLEDKDRELDDLTERLIAAEKNLHLWKPKE